MASYRFTDQTMNFRGVKLRKIESTRKFTITLEDGTVKTINKGDRGGWIQKKSNLSCNPNDYCWVDREAKVFDNAKVCKHALITDYAIVFDKAVVRDMAYVGNYATIKDNSEVYSEARITGNAEIAHDSRIRGNSRVFNNAWIGGNVVMEEQARVGGDCVVTGEARIAGCTIVTRSFLITQGEIVNFSDDSELNLYPIAIGGLMYPVTITDNNIKIGCRQYSFKEWFNFTDKEIDRLDEKHALSFWRDNKDMLKQICVSKRGYTE